MKVLPDHWAAKIPRYQGVPSVSFNQFKELSVRDTVEIGRRLTIFGVPLDVKRREFFKPLIGCDSGNPAFWIVKGELVLLNVWTNGGSGSGTTLVYQKSALNAAMRKLGGGYQVTEVDLNDIKKN